MPGSFVANAENISVSSRISVFSVVRRSYHGERPLTYAI